MGKLNLTKKDTSKQAGEHNTDWRILVVDDDPEVHAVTRLALKNLRFAGRGVEILSAYSAAQGREVMATEADIAIVLLDVVMETDDAGLRLAQSIRTELKNANVRIILRTGQPGQAPEEDVIVTYDINDYKAKTELTIRKLFTTTVTALRTYDYLRALDAHLLGLQQIIETSDALFQEHSLQQFASGVLIQLGTFLGVGSNGILCAQYVAPAWDGSSGLRILAASHPGAAGQALDGVAEALDPEVRELILATFERKGNIYGPDHTTLYLGRDNGPAMVAYLHCPPPGEPARRLVELFCSKIAIGFSNACLYEELRHANTQLEQKVAERTNELAEANRQLNYLVSTDALTGLPNRRHFLEALERQAAQTARDGAPFCVVMLDIDHFKVVNDRHGHGAGDLVLQMATERIGRSLREMDLMGRLGGEEFAVLLPGSTLAEALVVAERLRSEMAATPVKIGHMAVPVTISLGVAQATPGERGAPLLSRADSALCLAKSGGSNRVCGTPSAPAGPAQPSAEIPQPSE